MGREIETHVLALVQRASQIGELHSDYSGKRAAEDIAMQIHAALRSHGDELSRETLCAVRDLRVPFYEQVYSENYGEWQESKKPSDVMARVSAEAETLIRRRETGNTQFRSTVLTLTVSTGYVGWLDAKRLRGVIDNHLRKYQAKPLGKGAYGWNYEIIAPYESSEQIDRWVERTLITAAREAIAAISKNRSVTFRVYEESTSRNWIG